MFDIPPDHGNQKRRFPNRIRVNIEHVIRMRQSDIHHLAIRMEWATLKQWSRRSLLLKSWRQMSTLNRDHHVLVHDDNPLGENSRIIRRFVEEPLRTVSGVISQHLRQRT